MAPSKVHARSVSRNGGRGGGGVASGRRVVGIGGRGETESRKKQRVEDETRTKQRAETERPPIQKGERREGINSKESRARLVTDLLDLCRKRGLDVDSDKDGARASSSVFTSTPVILLVSGSTMQSLVFSNLTSFIVDVTAVIEAAEEAYRAFYYNHARSQALVGVKGTAEVVCDCKDNNPIAQCFLALANSELERWHMGGSHMMIGKQLMGAVAAIRNFDTIIESGDQAKKK
jgi:hypothetical protein